MLQQSSNSGYGRIVTGSVSCDVLSKRVCVSAAYLLNIFAALRRLATRFIIEMTVDQIREGSCKMFLRVWNSIGSNRFLSVFFQLFCDLTHAASTI